MGSGSGIQVPVGVNRCEQVYSARDSVSQVT